MSPYLSPYRQGAGQWLWGMPQDPARGRPVSGQGYTFGSNVGGVESVAGASVRVGQLMCIDKQYACPCGKQKFYGCVKGNLLHIIVVSRFSLHQLQVLLVSHHTSGKPLPLLHKVCIGHNTVII